MTKTFIVIKTITTIATEVFDVTVPESAIFPTTDDLAISATLNTKPIAAETKRSLDFQIIEKEETDAHKRTD